MKKILYDTRGISYIEVLIAGTIMLIILLATAAIISNSVSVNVNLIKSKEALSQMSDIFSDVKRVTNQIVSSYPPLTFADAVTTQPHHLHVVLYNPILYDQGQRFQTYRFALVVHDNSHYVVPGCINDINLLATSQRVTFDINGDGNYNTQEISSNTHPEWHLFPAVIDRENNITLRGGIRIFGIEEQNGVFLRPGLRIDTKGGPFSFRILAWAQIGNVTITNFQADDIEYLVLPSQVQIKKLSGQEMRQYVIKRENLDFDNIRRDGGQLTWNFTYDNSGDGLPDDLDFQGIATTVRWEGISGERSGQIMISPVVEDRNINSEARLQRCREILREIEENLYLQGFIAERPTHVTLHDMIIDYINGTRGLNNIQSYIEAQANAGNISPHAQTVLLTYINPFLPPS